MIKPDFIKLNPSLALKIEILAEEVQALACIF